MTHLEIVPASLAMGAQRVSALTPQAAAREFEAMLIAQLMKTAREAGALDDSADATGGHGGSRHAFPHDSEDVLVGR